MNRLTRALVLAISVSATTAGVALGNAGGVAAIPLNNGQETTDAKFGGSGSFAYWVDGTNLCYDLSVRNLTAAPIGAHIHGVAGRTEATGVVVPLVTPSAATSTVSGACAAVDATLLANILANPGNYYVNVHTPMFPGGEVRGQLK